MAQIPDPCAQRDAAAATAENSARTSPAEVQPNHAPEVFSGSIPPPLDHKDLVTQEGLISSPMSRYRLVCDERTLFNATKRPLDKTDMILEIKTEGDGQATLAEQLSSGRADIMNNETA